MTRGPFALLLVLLATVGASACAARGGVPRPFPVAKKEPVGALPAEASQPEATVDVTEAAESDTQKSVPAAKTPDALTGTSPLATAIVHTALTFLGTPYRNGGTDPSGFDCSGLVQYVFARHGEPLPREVREQFRHGRDVDLDDVAPGDLLFFETVSRGASHVGIAIGNGRFVHAPSSRGVVRVEPYAVAYWAKRFVGARRLGDASRSEAAFPGATEVVLPGAIRATR